jgi:hypothetical protein
MLVGGIKNSNVEDRQLVMRQLNALHTAGSHYDIVQRSIKTN